jgi:hypothetical protein
MTQKRPNRLTPAPRPQSHVPSGMNPAQSTTAATITTTMTTTTTTTIMMMMMITITGMSSGNGNINNNIIIRPTPSEVRLWQTVWP